MRAAAIIIICFPLANPRHPRSDDKTRSSSYKHRPNKFSSSLFFRGEEKQQMRRKKLCVWGSAVLCFVRTQESAGENEDEERRKKAESWFLFWRGRARVSLFGLLCVDENHDVPLFRFSPFQVFFRSNHMLFFRTHNGDLDECSTWLCDVTSRRGERNQNRKARSSDFVDCSPSHYKTES